MLLPFHKARSATHTSDTFARAGAGGNGGKFRRGTKADRFDQRYSRRGIGAMSHVFPPKRGMRYVLHPCPCYAPLMHISVIYAYFFAAAICIINAYILFFNICVTYAYFVAPKICLTNAYLLLLRTAFEPADDNRGQPWRPRPLAPRRWLWVTRPRSTSAATASGARSG